MSTKPGQVQVSGAAAAYGDNGVGIAGAIWGGPIREYGMAVGTQLFRSPNYVPDTAMARAGADGAHIMLVANDYGTNNSALYAYYAGLVRLGIKKFLAANPRNIVVKSAGNDTTRQSVANFAAGQSHRPWVILRAVSELFASGDPDTARIIVATAANAAYTGFWSGSNELQGATGSIAAPGEDVLSLGLNNSVNSYSGTSLAAPLVAGAAALLMGFDSSLTGAEVKQLLASDSAYDAQGDPTSKPKIGSSTVLDAYAPLVTRARAHHNLPICGFPLRIGVDRGFTTLYAVLERRGAPDSFAIPSTTNNISVAQGGRRIALWGDSGTLVTDQLGNSIVTDTSLIQYLERDTAFTGRDGNIVIKGPDFSTPYQVNPARVIGDVGVSPPNALVSPNADTIGIASYQTSSLHACPPNSGIGQGATTTMRGIMMAVNNNAYHETFHQTYDSCDSFGFDGALFGIAWSHDSQHLLYESFEPVADTNTLFAVTPSYPASGTKFSYFRVGEGIFNVYWTANDSLVFDQEDRHSGCISQFLLASNLTASGSTSSCTDGAQRYVPNAPQATVTGRKSLSTQGPASDLMRAVLRGRKRFQVN